MKAKAAAKAYDRQIRGGGDVKVVDDDMVQNPMERKM